MSRSIAAGCLFALLAFPVAGKGAALAAPAAPAPVGPYSPAVDAGPLVFLSGQIAIDPTTGKLDKSRSVGAQTKQVWSNIAAVLEARCLDLRDVVQAQVFLTDMTSFPEMNAAYAEAMGTSRPARTTVAVVALPLGAAVEIAVVAKRRRGGKCA